MKTKTDNQKSLLTIWRSFLITLAILFMLAGAGSLVGQEAAQTTNTSTDDKIVAALDALNDDKPSKPNIIELFGISSDHRGQVVQELLEIFNNPKSKDSVKGYAAYYLGQLHASEAVDSLASQITLSFLPTGHSNDDAPWRSQPCLTALRVIGTSSIPVLIRNLAESDEGKKRELSLWVLYHIEKDKDIVQLRLQKALAAEKDSQKQARLQAALKSLAETSF